MKFLRNSLLLLLACFALASGQTISEATSEDYLRAREVGKQIKCQCPSQCAYTVTECNMLHCSFGEPVKEEIKELVAAGLPNGTIIEQLVAKYGSVLRTAPETKGFGLYGWAMPFAAVLLGLIAAPVLVWRWKAKHDSQEVQPASTSVSDADVERFRGQIEQNLEAME